MSAVLRITDGTDWVDLINGPWYLADWTPQVAQPKGGGVYKDSPLSGGKRLSVFQWDSVVETMDLKARDMSQDALIHTTQKLRRLLDKAQQYWTTDWQDAPVYIEAKASMETNTRYALISQGSLQVDDNYYAQPFLQPGCVAAMDEMLLVMERGHWTGNKPGIGTALSMDTQHYSDYNIWELVDTAGGDWDNLTQLMAVDNNDYLYAIDSGDVYRSINDGDTWAIRYNYAGTAYSITSAPNGNLYLGGTNAGAQSAVLKSTDGGATFNEVDTLATHTRVYEIRAVDDSHILAWHYDWGGADHSILRYSDDGGTTWATVLTATGIYFGLLGSIDTYVVTSIQESINISHVYISDDYGATWIRIEQILAGVNRVVGVPDSSGTFIIPAIGDSYLPPASGQRGSIYISYNYGASWTHFNPATMRPIVGIAFDSNNIMYGISEGDIGVGYLPYAYISSDGVNWNYDFMVGAGVDAFPADIVCTSDDVVVVIEQDKTWNRLPNYTLGMEAGTSGHFVSNLYRTHNLTHIKRHEDGVGYTDLIDTAPYDLFPDPVSQDDTIYFGFATETIANPWQSLVFDLSAVMKAVDYTIDWEYWVAAWTTLPIVDNTGPDTQPFSYLGINSVHWQFPTDWAITTVDGVDAYWIRATLSSVTTPTVVPVQQTRDVYSISYPYVTIDDTDLLGDINCIAKARLINASDENGPEGDVPYLYENKVTVASRLVSRGSNFAAYLNVSNWQNSPAIIATIGRNTLITESKIAPTGYRGVYNPTGLLDWADQVTFVIAADSSTEFIGSYHAYLRCQEYDASNDPGNISTRLKVSGGQGGIEQTTEALQCTTINNYTVLDFGKIVIPATSILRSTQQVNRSSIIIQCKANSNETDLYMYDLILLPCDEMIIQASNARRSTYSFNYGDNGLVIDSIESKQTVRAFIEDSNSYVRAVYGTDGKGLYLLPNQAQQLWFFAQANYVVHAIDDSAVDDKAYFEDSTGDFIRRGVKVGDTLVNTTNGSSYPITQVSATQVYAGTDNDNGDEAYIITDVMVSSPEICHQVTLETNPRYLAARGKR